MNSEEQTFCDGCGKVIHSGYEMTSISESDNSPNRTLCLECSNKHMADYVGLDIQVPQFPPMVLFDYDNKEHEFSFATRLNGTQVSIEAYEADCDPGYEFQVLGDPYEAQKLFKKLVGKMKRALSYQHLEKINGRLSISDANVIRGRFDWDEEEDGHVPSLVIDGKKIKWEEFGHILTCVEGWQFKIQIFDPSEEA